MIKQTKQQNKYLKKEEIILKTRKQNSQRDR